MTSCVCVCVCRLKLVQRSADKAESLASQTQTQLTKEQVSGVLHMFSWGVLGRYFQAPLPRPFPIVVYSVLLL